MENGKVGKLYGDQQTIRECYYVNLKSLRNGERTPPGKTSQPDKAGKKATIEATEVLHPQRIMEDPHLEPISELVAILLDPS